MKFAHMADLHLGAWSNHPVLREMPLKAFKRAVDVCIDERVDFVIIAGDFFDTSIPSIDVMRFAVSQLKRLHDKGIRVYVITGSHDSSPSGKTIISVLEEAGLLVNIAKITDDDDGKEKIKLTFTKDADGAKLCGIVGRRCTLEKSYFERLDRSLEKERGYKIFVFHSALEEYKPKHLKDMPAISRELLPKGFDYYAAGHVHVRAVFDFHGSKIVYPGPLFPANFQELEKNEAGFFIIDGRKEKYVPLKTVEVFLVNINAEGKTPGQVEEELISAMTKDVGGKVVLIRVHGVLAEGKPSDIDFRAVMQEADEKGALTVKRNLNKLKAKEFEEVAMEENLSIDEIESKVIKEHLKKQKTFESEEDIIHALMGVLSQEKKQGETNTTFETRIKQATKKILGVE